MDSKNTKTTAPESQEAQDPTLGGNTPSETSADATENTPTNGPTNATNDVAALSRFDKIRQLIQAGDAKELQRLFYGRKDPTKVAPYGGMVRETISMIAMQPEYHDELIKLATAMTVRWVNPISLIRLIAALRPRLYLLDTPDDPMTLPEIQEMASRIPELTASEIIDFLKNLYFWKNQLRRMPRNFAANLAARVIESSLFDDRRQALFCLTQFIPDPFPFPETKKARLTRASKQQRWKKISRGFKAQVARRAVEKALKKPQSDRQSHDVGEQETALLPPYATDFGRDLTSQCYAALNGNP